MEASTPQPMKRRKPRSPSYPGIPLDVALDRARSLYEQEGRHSAPVTAIVEHWGYGQKSSGGLITLAALKKFGLLADEGNRDRRQAKLTDLALRILLDEREDMTDLRAAVQQAALTPPIHKALWERYGSRLPSDATLRTHLLLELDFTESGVKEFIPEFRRTIEYAGLLESQLDGSSEDDSAGRDRHEGSVAGRVVAIPSPSPAQRPTEGALPASAPRTVQIPVSQAAWVAFQGAFPLTEAEWQQMMAVLAAMKPALTGDRDPQGEQ
jgi:hypothetical protein